MTCEGRVWQGVGTHLWFWSCRPCGGCEGGYLTEAEAREGWRHHAEKAEGRRRRRAEALEDEAITAAASDLFGLRAGGRP